MRKGGDMAQDDLLRQQMAYYAARAQEYDESIQRTGRFAADTSPDADEQREWDAALLALTGLGHFDETLELAAGTGTWTKELLALSQRITALDGSQEMLDINRAKLSALPGHERVTYERANLFDWQPTGQYDLVVFGFWLSHIPPEALPTFWEKISRAVKTGGRVFIMDEPAGGRQLSGPPTEGITQTRTLHDGRAFQIVKVYYDPADIARQLQARGFERVEFTSGECFFHLSGVRG
jgi:SAM-dependent methyltransferase